jgi:signal transduction histidine kinase
MNPWIIDGVIAAAFVIVGFLGTSGRGNVPRSDYQPMDALGIALVLGATVPFAFLRRAALAVLIVAGSCVVMLSWLGYNEGVTPIFLYVAAVAVGISCTSWKTAAGAAFMFVALIALLLVSHTQFDAGQFALNVAIFTSAFMIGVTIRSRRLRIVALEDRAAAVEREREEEARNAATRERLRIARELHDVVAHSMGVIAVQAGTGEHLIDTDPDHAKRSLHAIAEVSRSALVEIRRMLGVLREDDGSDGAGPTRGLDDLDDLARELGGSQVDVRVAIQGDRAGLPRSVDLTAYRIVQEALTNVLKHAGQATASVSVDYDPGAVRLTISDDGDGDERGRPEGPGGYGLVGMRERVAAYGGTFAAGPRSGGGFEVSAWLPYEESRA